ncbi:MAG: winged helix-turn-helix domain-containing protein [Candidatus Dormibacteria bacterium]
MVKTPALPALTLAEARRLALDAQRLGTRPECDQPPTVESVTALVRRLGYLQRDPLAVVAPSHRLVLWSRLGRDAFTEVEAGLWEQRSLFEYWAHAAAILPTSDFPLHRWRMQHYRRGPATFDAGTQSWIEGKRSLRRSILRRLATDGPLPASAFASHPTVPRVAGWSSWGDHQRMLELLWFQGLTSVAGRDRRGRLWALTESWLPDVMTGPPIPQSRALIELAARSLEALGVATGRQIGTHLIGGAPRSIAASIDRLCALGLAQEVEVVGDSGPLPGRWLASMPAVRSWEKGLLRDWSGRTTLLSPFDNLIIDRARTEAIFDFHYRMEIYVPRAQRRYGYYVLPILHQDRMVGRVDCRRDIEARALEVLSVHAEPRVPHAPEIGALILLALRSLATAVGMEEVALRDPGGVPTPWKTTLGC